MRKKLNKTVLLMIIAFAAFMNFENIAFSAETLVLKTKYKQVTPPVGTLPTKSQINTVKTQSSSQVQKPNLLQLKPKVSSRPPLPGASNKITVKPMPVLTLNNYIKSFQKPYLNVYISALTILSDNETVTSYDSSKGEIRAKLKNGKELYVLVAPFQNSVTKVRMTPADGVYDIPIETIRGIFAGINTELLKH